MAVCAALRVETLEPREVPATVTSLLDDGSAGTLRSAIAATADGGVVDFAPGLAGTIQLDRGRGNLLIDKSLSINGPGAAALTVRGAFNGIEGIRVFNVDDGTAAVHAVAISGLTISGGNPVVQILQRPPRPPIINALPGGGVFNAEALTLTDCVISGNTAASGGGISTPGTLTATRVLVNGNVAGRGGGIENTGTARLTDCTVSGNTATASYAGGGGVVSIGDFAAERSTFSANNATRGGGLWLNDGTAKLTHVTVSGNRALFSDEGGIASTADLLAIHGCTITANDGDGAAAVQVTAGVTDIVNSILAGPPPVSSTPYRIDIRPGNPIDTTVYVRASLIGGIGPTAVLSSNEANLIGTPQNPIDPRLGPLAYNGGQTLTHALLADSPAVNRGSNELAAGLPTDQRGDGFRRRFADRIDMGAIEFSEVIRAVAVGAGQGGGPRLNVHNADGSVRRSSLAFEQEFTGGVRTATGDVTGDGIPDVIVASGPGRVAEVKLFDGLNGFQVRSAEPFAGFTGGAFVAVGDFDGDGFADVAVTPDEGGGGRVVVLDGATFAAAASFLAIDDENFRGGCRPAAGDVDGDGVVDLVVSAGFGGGPRVAVFDGATPTKLMNDFFAFEEGLRNGTYAAVGDVNGDGRGELIFGGGPGGGPRVLILDPVTLVQEGVERAAVGNFIAGNVDDRGGIRVAAADLDGDELADVIVGAGGGAGSRVAAFGAASILAGTPTPTVSFDAFPDFAGGVFVG